MNDDIEKRNTAMEQLAGNQPEKAQALEKFLLYLMGNMEEQYLEVLTLRLQE